MWSTLWAEQVLSHHIHAHATHAPLNSHFIFTKPQDGQESQEPQETQDGQQTQETQETKEHAKTDEDGTSDEGATPPYLDNEGSSDDEGSIPDLDDENSSDDEDSIPDLVSSDEDSSDEDHQQGMTYLHRRYVWQPAGHGYNTSDQAFHHQRG